jgi:type II secretory pathway pseudopilin PulG
MTDRLSAQRLSGEGGFTLIAVLVLMAIVALFSAGAYAAVNSDLLGSGDDVARKQAMAAAEAGVANYLFQLNEDSAYWTKCTGAGPGLNDPWTGTTPPVGTQWRTVPGESTQYAIELLPARNSGYTTCNTDPDKIVDSMIDPATRSLRIRVTGRATSSKGTVKRSVIASMRRTNFLDYLWFTDYETQDQKWWDRTVGGEATQSAQGDIRTWGANTCPRYYRPAPAGLGSAGYNRPGQSWSGKVDLDGDGQFEWNENKSYSCDDLDLQFASGDKLLGPFHTNDELLACNGFTVGRDSGDRVESGRSWRPCSSGATPNIQGTLIENAETLKLPPTDAALGLIAATGYKFVGKTVIRLGTDTFSVTNNGITAIKTYPTNGVIYVGNDTSPSNPCGYSYQPLNPYNQSSNAYDSTYRVPAGCGQVWVSGTYNKDLTIATQDDIIVDGDIKKASTTDARLGLIADNFVRVWHPVNRDWSDPTDCSEPSGSARISGRQIDAAILSLLHSFMVDNFYCGGTIGTLTVNGVIAQKFRGAVATGNGSTGFLKDYDYDERLAFKGPPHFLDPVKSAWKQISFTEQQGPH